jgi:hypothetical protein
MRHLYLYRTVLLSSTVLQLCHAPSLLLIFMENKVNPIIRTDNSDWADYAKYNIFYSIDASWRAWH